MTSVRKNDFEYIIANLVDAPEEEVWLTAIEAVFAYYKFNKEEEYIKTVLERYSKELTENGDNTPRFGKMVKVVVKIAQLNLHKFNLFIENLIFRPNSENWQLEVISNTTNIFGRNMYTKGALLSGLDFFSEQYKTMDRKSEKAELMLYTIKNMVESLQEDKEGRFVSQVVDFIKKYLEDPKKNFNLGIMALEVLNQFYEFNF